MVSIGQYIGSRSAAGCQITLSFNWQRVKDRSIQRSAAIEPVQPSALPDGATERSRNIDSSNDPAESDSTRPRNSRKANESAARRAMACSESKPSK
jgi:hypothetical protein